MSDRVTLSAPTSNVQTRVFRSHSYNPPLPVGSHRSRRTLSLPAREKPMIPPVITESSECLRSASEQPFPEPSGQGNCDEIGWFAPILGLFLSLVLFAWACFLSLSDDELRALLS